jgi:copper chaperone CopZ
MEPVRSALLSVKGVTRARVTLEGHEATVTYDPAQATTADMIAAVNKAEGVAGPKQYGATVKKPAPPSTR